MRNPYWAVALGLVLGAVLAIAFGVDRARGAALVGFSDEPAMFAEYGSDSVHANATGARIIIGWNHDPSELTGAIEELHIATTPIITLYTLNDVDLNAYGAQCAAFARAWPHAVIQAGNEPNIEIGGTQSVPQVVEQVTVCERAVHEVDPNRKVLGPAIAPVNMDDESATVREYFRTEDNAQWHRYMKALYDQLPSSVGTAMNIYPYGQNPIDKLREDLRWGKQFRRPVWVTETAMLGDYGRKKAAKLAARSSRWLKKHGARSVLFHRLAQGPVDPVGWKTYAINAAGERTALYKALRKEWAR